MSHDFKELQAKRRASGRVGVPQVDPGAFSGALPAAASASPDAPANKTSSTPDQTSSAKPSVEMPAAPVARPAMTSQFPMPPSHDSEARIQFNARLQPELVERVRLFAAQHRVTVQDVAEYAMDEFLKQRGG